MAHETFYRKYRSRTFSELIGQDHIVKTLENAISNDRLSHAYIFSGPRGTGKTSTARILAKSLNCRDGVSFSPCLKCDLCEKISAGASVDVIEIDAASHTGVDNIRDLNEQVNFVPVECLYKVYIIDEVHMLSGGAFNALLKTLEEPPGNTVFILATTEPHKIPVTIHSRCQRLHFRRVSNPDIISHLKSVGEKEGMSISEAALGAIARNSQGCVRDSLSLLDQLYSFKGDAIDVNDVQLMLGASNFEDLAGLLKAVFSGDLEGVMRQLGGMVARGVHAVQLAQDLGGVVRGLMFFQQGLKDFADVDDSRVSVFEELSGMVGFERLMGVLEKISKLEMELRWFADPETLLQVSVLGIAREGSSILQQTQPGAAPQPSPPPQPQMSSARVPSTPNPVVDSSLTPSSGGGEKVELEVKVEENPSWDKVLGRVKRERRVLYGVLEGSRLVSEASGVLSVELNQEYSFFLEKVNEAKNMGFIERLAGEVFGKDVRVRFALIGQGVGQGIGVEIQSSSGGLGEREVEGKVKVEEKKASSSFNQIVEMFEGTVV